MANGTSRAEKRPAESGDNRNGQPLACNGLAGPARATSPGDRRPWNPYSAACPSRLMLDRIADKWVMLTIGLLADGPMRFNQLRRAIDGVSQKMLSQTLKVLERDGLVTRRAIATVPVTVEYSITALGQTLVETISELRRWPEANMEAVLAAQRRYDARDGG